MLYKTYIAKLIEASPLEINPDIEITGKIPTTVSSEFITNKEQGDWAENLVFETINKFSKNYIAVRYGRDEGLSAGDEGFKEFYLKYIEELNKIGKRPDLLIFHKRHLNSEFKLNENIIKKAVAALEVRSPSFLVNKYEHFMDRRVKEAYKNINKIRKIILGNIKLSTLLQSKNITLYNFLLNTSDEGLASLSFRVPSWSSSKELELLSHYLKEIKENIKIVQKRDYLSITPKLEDIALINRWIQTYNVPHFYLQVFFDKAFIISFADILKISSDTDKEGLIFSIEKDIKNQGKTTVKINIHYTDLIIDEIKIPEHYSKMKELDRGRLLFYVKFKNSEGKLITDILEGIINGKN